jgi:lipoprotein-anchoring transpeptidase ErfK/SrfK
VFGRLRQLRVLLGKRPRQRYLLLGPICAIAAFAVAIGGVFAYGTSRSSLISPGVKIAGIDVGSQDRAGAQSTLQTHLAPGSRILTFTGGGQQFSIPEDQTGLTPDVQKAVDGALRRSQSKDPLSRLVSDLTGKKDTADLPLPLQVSSAEHQAFLSRAHGLVDHPPAAPSISVSPDGTATVTAHTGSSLSQQALESQITQGIVDPRSGTVISIPTQQSGATPAQRQTEIQGAVARAKQMLDRPAQNATLTPTGDGLSVTDEKQGRAVDSAGFSNALSDQLSRAGVFAVKVPVVPTNPAVTRSQLQAQYPYYITINRSTFELKLFKNLGFSHGYRIAVGMIGLETPAGLYHIQNKSTDPAWYVPNEPWAGPQAGKVIPPNAPDNPIKARWMGIADGAGIHGTDDLGSLGSAASHGCIRMNIGDVIDLFNQVPVQTPVFIA